MPSLKEMGQKQDKLKEFLGWAQIAGLLPPDKKEASAEWSPQLPALGELWDCQLPHDYFIYFLAPMETRMGQRSTHMCAFYWIK